MQISGIAIKSGVAFGAALHLSKDHKPLDYRVLPKKRIPQQLTLLDSALHRLKMQLQASLAVTTAGSEARALVEADLMRMCVPATYGGPEVDPVTMVEAIATVAPASITRRASGYG